MADETPRNAPADEKARMRAALTARYPRGGMLDMESLYRLCEAMLDAGYRIGRRAERASYAADVAKIKALTDDALDQLRENYKEIEDGRRAAERN